MKLGYCIDYSTVQLSKLWKINLLLISSVTLRWCYPFLKSYFWMSTISFWHWFILYLLHVIQETLSHFVKQSPQFFLQSIGGASSLSCSQYSLSGNIFFLFFTLVWCVPMSTKLLELFHGILHTLTWNFQHPNKLSLLLTTCLTHAMQESNFS